MTNYIDYQIAEIYAANTDWPQSNVRYWRAYAPGSQWRWILHDLDTAFGNNMANGVGQNTLRLAMSKKGPKAYHSLILIQLSRNADFRALFAQRFAAHLNTTFAPERMTGLLNNMSATIAADMPAQTARWKLPKGVGFWNTQLTKMRAFLQKRPAFVITHLNEYLGKPGTALLTTAAGAAGDIVVAGVPVPDSYSGLAFKNTPLTLTAVPAPGQLFVRWAETGQTTPQITITLAGAATYTAIFDAEPPPPPVPDIVINEIHYRPLPESAEPDREFIELYHAGATTADLSGYTISAISYTFPNGAQIAPGEYIVVAANSADPAYAALAPGRVFDWDWGDDAGHKLSNSSEAVTLRHADGRVVDTVTYDESSPWPPEADGDGPSLALLDETLDNALPASWAKSREIGGTPGAENFPPRPPVPAVVINEIHYNPADAQGPDAGYEFIELVNTSGEPVALEG
ncbi:MAG TPA: lamin tail domain-containing protein, partial [Promineifilum sp.]|nr:lamin tail domain-containing protein [Promineifilum sp.]